MGGCYPGGGFLDHHADYIDAEYRDLTDIKKLDKPVPALPAPVLLLPPPEKK